MSIWFGRLPAHQTLGMDRKSVWSSGRMGLFDMGLSSGSKSLGNFGMKVCQTEPCPFLYPLRAQMANSSPWYISWIFMDQIPDNSRARFLTFAWSSCSLAWLVLTSNMFVFRIAMGNHQSQTWLKGNFTSFTSTLWVKHRFRVVCSLETQSIDGITVNFAVPSWNILIHPPIFPLFVAHLVWLPTIFLLFLKDALGFGCVAHPPTLGIAWPRLA